MPNTIADYETIHEPAALSRDTLPQLTSARMTRIECCRFDDELAEKLHPGSGHYCCGLLTIATDCGAVGFGEFAIPRTSLNGDLVMWASPFYRLKGQTLLEGFNFVQAKQAQWGAARCDLLLSALASAQGNRGLEAVHREVTRCLSDRAFLLRHTQACIAF